MRETADSNLAFIHHQLSLLQDNMTQEQRRLSNIIQKKNKKIQSQKHLIRKMKNQIDMQKLQMNDDLDIFHDKAFKKTSQSNKSLPTIIVEDTNEMKEEPTPDETRSYSTTLRRQSKFTKGAERPKLFVLKGSACRSQNQPGVSWQNLSQTLNKNLSAESCRNIPRAEREMVKSRVKQSESPSDGDSGVWSGRSCNDDVDMEHSKDRFRRRESYQRAVTAECQGKARVLAKMRHKTILETNLKRFSSYSHLPDVR